MKNNKNVDLHSRLVPINTCFPFGLSFFGAGEGVGSDERRGREEGGIFSFISGGEFWEGFIMIK
jgi:hypothetical protein